MVEGGMLKFVEILQMNCKTKRVCGVFFVTNIIVRLAGI